MRAQHRPYPHRTAARPARHTPPAACRPGCPRGPPPPPAPTCGWLASTASISPGSMRNPRIFTCSSARPRYSSRPSAGPPRPSPVRYIRSPARRRTDRPRTAPPSAPARPSTPAPAAHPPDTAHPPHPPAPAAAAVQHVDARVLESAGRSALPDHTVSVQVLAGAMHSRLSDPVHVDQPRTTLPVPRPPGASSTGSSASRRTPRPATPPATAAALLHRHQLVERRRRLTQQRHPLALQQHEEVLRRPGHLYETTTTRPPCSSAPHNSHTEKSNATEWNQLHTSLGRTPNAPASARTSPSTLACAPPRPWDAR